MRLSFFVMIMATLTVSANSNLMSQQVNLDFRDTELRKVFKSLKEQTGRMIFYSETEIAADRNKVTVSLHNVPLTYALEVLLKELPYTFSIVDNMVLIIPSPEMTAQQPQRVSLSGRVTDSEQKPLPGVAVVIKGTTTGVYTDANGEFLISFDDTGGLVLRFSYIGKKTMELPYTGQPTVSIVVEDYISQIDDVLVTGYQRLTRERATGSFGRVDKDKIGRAHASDLSTALLGSVAGMQGKENEDGTIDYIIRGQTTLFGEVQPLVVVDGFPVSTGFADINPNDVESVTVLKDAAAASIWGARSANGVIVITTKKGAADGDKGSVSIETNVLFRMGSKYDLGTVLTTGSSAEQIFYEQLSFDKKWMQLPDDNFMTLHQPFSMSKQYIFDYHLGRISETEMNEGLEKLSKLNNRKQIRNMLLDNPFTQQYNLTIRQGGERMRNYLSAMYEHNVGNFMGSSNRHWRLNYSTDIRIFKWMEFNLGVNVHYSKAKSNNLNMADIRELNPYEMILNDDGSYATQEKKNRTQLAKVKLENIPYPDWEYNILREARGTDVTNEMLNTRLQTGLTFKVIDGLTVDTKLQYELNKGEFVDLRSDDTYRVRNFVNSYIEYDRDNDVVITQFVPKGGIKDESYTRSNNYIWRNQINFDKVLGAGHAINALAGFEMSEYLSTGTVVPTVYGYNPVTNTGTPLPFGSVSFDRNGQKVRIWNITGSNIASLGSMRVPYYSYRTDRYVSIYGNMSYSFEDRYTFSLSARSDASNLISDKPSKRWEPLWSAGASWNIRNEDFLRDAGDWIDRLSVRFTYGMNGNVDKTTSPYTLISTGSAPSVTTGLNYSYVSNRGNMFLRWEKTRSVNGGADFAFFGNRLFGMIEFYDKKGKDLIGAKALPPVSGAPSQLMNTAQLSNRGVEVSLGVNTRINKNIRFTTTLNYSYNKNRITDLKHPVYKPVEIIDARSRDKSEWYFVEGYPIDAVWSFKYLGMENGIAYIEGTDGAKVPMSEYSAMNIGNGLDVLKYMGSYTSPHTLGWSGTFSLYGVNLSFLVTGQFGGRFRAPTFDYNMTTWGKENVSIFIRDVMDGSNKIPSWGPDSWLSQWEWTRYTKVLNTMVENSSFIKLKEVSVDYTLPYKWTAKAGLQSVKVYGQVRNLGCLWTKNSYGYDPEWLPGSMKPVTTYLLGLTINFK